MPRDLDLVDKRILRMLQRDGRVTITEMGENLHMTRSAVRYRIQQMESDGIIVGYSAVLNPHKINDSILSKIIIRVKPANLPPCIKELRSAKEVMEIQRLTGDASLSVTAFFRSPDHRNNFILNRLEKLPIEGYTLQTVLDVVKRKGYPL